MAHRNQDKKLGKTSSMQAKGGAASSYDPSNSSSIEGSVLLNKFNPFNKRVLGESFNMEYGRSRRKPNEESKFSSGIMPRSYRGVFSPYKFSKDPGGSFLDLYSDTEFSDLDTQEVITRLNKNLVSFRNLHAKAKNQIEELKELQAKQQKTSKEGSLEDREINENLDKRLTLLYELEVKIKSLEQILSKLEDCKNLEQKLARNNNDIKDDTLSLRGKDMELVNERESKKQLVGDLKEDLNYQINEVKFCEILEIKATIG